MAETGFVIDAISVEGPGKASAALQFAAGLNVIAGASNTGKTYVFQIIDFMLGASRLPKPVPEAVGYAEAYLQLTSKAGEVSTYRRSLQGGDLQSYNAAIESIGDDPTPKTLASKHEKGNVDTMSGRLLTMAGLFGRELRLNSQGEKVKLAKKVETSTATKFCEVLEKTLKAWKFPFEGHVSFDPKRFDVVIGDQNRGSFGKGYRAVTHAAFVVALMRYCRSEGLPHPGIVALDTPLNPFKGPDKDSPDRINQEVQDAFYADLAADKSGDQFIVFENTEPSASMKAKISYTHFSGNPTAGRVGFFPSIGAEDKS